MGISCTCDIDDAAWYYEVNDHPIILDTRRSRKCVSCRARIAVGNTAYRISRYRPPRSDIEDRIYGDEVPMADWFFCPSCHAIYQSLDKVNVCVDLGQDDLREALQEFNQLYAPKGFSLKVPGHAESLSHAFLSRS